MITHKDIVSTYIIYEQMISDYIGQNLQDEGLFVKRL